MLGRLRPSWHPASSCHPAAARFLRGLSTQQPLPTEAPRRRRGGCIAYGEIIFDCFEDGTAVVGGSPLNFAVGLRQLGLEVGMVSSLGCDQLGAQARAYLASTGVDCDLVHESKRPTGQVNVTIVDGEPQYDVDLSASWREIPAPIGPAPRPELLYIGSTARQTPFNAAQVNELVTQLRPVHVLFDLNLRPGLFAPESVAEGLHFATIVKMNTEEWEALPSIGITVDSPADLLAQFELDILAVTDGEGGACLYAHGGGSFNCAADLVEEVVDTVGAGDAFTAVLAAGVLRNGINNEHGLQATLQAACSAGAAAVASKGAHVKFSPDLLHQLHYSIDLSTAVADAHAVRFGGRSQGTQMQIALDLVDVPGAMSLLQTIAADSASSTDYDDLMPEIIEVGTPLIISDGLGAVRQLKSAFPESLVLADLKIMDAGEHEAALGFAAGADIVTVLSVAHDETIRGCVRAARRAGGRKEVMVDLINSVDPGARAKQVEALGVDIVCVHTAFDVQHAHDPLQTLRLVSSSVNRCAVACAGGVKPGHMSSLMQYAPEIVVVGGFIGNARDPIQANKDIRAHFLSQAQADAARAKARTDLAQAQGALRLVEAQTVAEQKVGNDASAMKFGDDGAGGAGGSEGDGGGTSVITKLRSVILSELASSAAHICPTSCTQLVSQLLDANRIFVAGMGRSGFAMRGFAMRMMHLGLDVHFVGETTAPPIASQGDLLLLGSGSGRTATLISHAERVVALGGAALSSSCPPDPSNLERGQSGSDLAEQGASVEDKLAWVRAQLTTSASGNRSRVALITTDPSSPLGAIAQETGGATVVLPAPTPKASGGVAAASGGLASAQPMATLFEQTLGLTCDAMVLELMEKTGQSTEPMFARHTNLE